jgi:hypothetical protein
MESRDWIIVVAMLVAPLLAVQVQKWIERFREKRGKRLRIFQTLMSTRMARLSPYHVEALNMIDTEFYSTPFSRLIRRSKKEKAVLDAWKSYLDHLESLGDKPTDVQLQTWVVRKDELFIDLLFDMSKCVGYDFDKVHLKRSIYSPRAHGEEEQDLKIIRENLVAVLSGDKAIPMTIIVPEELLSAQTALQTSLQEYYDGKRTVRVRVEKDREDGSE